MVTVFNLKHEYSDKGFCREVYSYTGVTSGSKYFYCVQEEFENVYVIYSCTKDHEPISEVNFKKDVEVIFEPSNDEGTDTFLKSKGLLEIVPEEDLKL